MQMLISSLSNPPQQPIHHHSPALFHPNLSGHRRITPTGIKSPSRRFRYQSMATDAETASSSSPTRVIKLEPVEATPETFGEFGQVVESSDDGDQYGPKDARLDLARGIPRFYIMNLKDRALNFSTITHHANVTQCLGSISGHVWYLGVAKRSIVDSNEIHNRADVVQSHCGHYYVPPNVDDVKVFKVSGPKFLKLEKGTWHAGPLFLEKSMDFYNLELSDTNVVDHTTHSFVEKDNVVFVFDE